MIRQFYLENNNGQTFYFKYSNHVLISEVTGIGFSFDYKYLKFDHIFETIKQDVTIAEIAGTLSFLDGYLGYQRLIDFLTLQSKNLKLYYKDIDLKYVYVDVYSLSKTEIVNGYLKSEIVFHKKSYWIKEKQLLLDFGTEIVGKNYPYVYPVSYVLTKAEETRVSVSGIKNAATVIEILGDINKPELTVYKQGRVLTSMKLDLIKDNSRLIISSVPNNRYIKDLTNGIDSDIYALQDFNKDNFIMLEPGELLIEFKSGRATNTLCKLTIYEYHLG